MALWKLTNPAYVLKRHPIPISAFFRHSLVLTYAFPPEVLQPLVPRGLVLDVFRESAFLAIALVQTENLRPSFLPAALGSDFFLCGYRIFTRLNKGSRSKRGLRILRSYADSRWMVNAGNLLTHYNYRPCQAEIAEENHGIRCTIRTPQSEADLDIVAHFANGPANLPKGSPFKSFAEARRFAGPLPYTFDFEVTTGAIIAICANRQNWNPTPVMAEVRRNTFLEKEPFSSVPPLLANAFHVQNVPYAWQRGSLVA